MQDIQNTTEFSYALMDERNTIELFIDILQKEQKALIQSQIDDVDFLTSDKARLVEKLKHLGEQRNQYLLAQGVTADSAGMDKWLALNNRNSELKTIWNELLQLAETAQQANKNNGLIITSLMQHNQRAFAALQSAAGNISLYGPKGQAFV